MTVAEQGRTRVCMCRMDTQACAYVCVKSGARGADVNSVSAVYTEDLPRAPS